MSLYRIFFKWQSGFGHFSAFFELWTVFRYLSPKKIKILTLIFGSQKCLFQKCTFSGHQLSRRGPVWYLLNSWKAPKKLFRKTCPKLFKAFLDFLVKRLVHQSHSKVWSNNQKIVVVWLVSCLLSYVYVTPPSTCGIVTLAPDCSSTFFSLVSVLDYLALYTVYSTALHLTVCCSHNLP